MSRWHKHVRPGRWHFRLEIQLLQFRNFQGKFFTHNKISESLPERLISNYVSKKHNTIGFWRLSSDGRNIDEASATDRHGRPHRYVNGGWKIGSAYNEHN